MPRVHADWRAWFRPQLPAPERLTPQEARVISAWRMTVDAWNKLTDQERAEKRFNYFKAPGFVA